MKTARRCLAASMYVAIWFTFLPFAVVRVSTEWLIDSFVIPTLDSLEAIANDK